VASSTKSRWRSCATDLARLGLARDEAMSETEDHVAYLCEVMRYLIAGDDVAVSNLTRSSASFSPPTCSLAADALCDAVAQHPKARFYASLAAFTRFRQRRSQGFDMLG
jgi:TorA maturation chaperone TorD